MRDYDAPPLTKDVGILGERVNADIEQAYRRGFSQGAFEVVRYLEHGASDRAVREWVTKTVMRWRMRVQTRRRKFDNTIKVEWPPILHLPSKNKTR